MRLMAGRYYTKDNSDLVIYINKVHYRSAADYVKVKLTISSKSNGEVCENPKNYKLYIDKISDWQVYNA